MLNLLSANGMSDKRSNIVTVPKDLSEMEYENANQFLLHVTSEIIVDCTQVAFRMKGTS